MSPGTDMRSRSTMGSETVLSPFFHSACRRFPPLPAWLSPFRYVARRPRGKTPGKGLTCLREGFTTGEADASPEARECKGDGRRISQEREASGVHRRVKICFFGTASAVLPDFRG